MTERLAALNAGDSFDFWGNDEPKCPHCGTSHNISRQEWWHLYADDSENKVECPTCGMDFVVRSQARYTFSTDEQDDD